MIYIYGALFDLKSALAGRAGGVVAVTSTQLCLDFVANIIVRVSYHVGINSCGLMQPYDCYKNANVPGLCAV